MCVGFPNLFRVANIIAASLMFAGGIGKCINGGKGNNRVDILNILSLCLFV
jgi:hypothetical protein